MLSAVRVCMNAVNATQPILVKILASYGSVQEVAAMYPDRVITIRGNIDNMSGAEAAISLKLRECCEKEMQAPMVS